MRMVPELPKSYWYLALARIILVFIPQHGYLHPDEFFQSVEPQAGRAFKVECNIPWEYNSSFPIRSVTIPYFTIGVAFHVANILDYFLRGYLTQTIITPYLVLVVPRFLMCILSFLVDATIFKICIGNNEKYKSKLVILASSYVMIVYATHTFSNTFELILLALLQYYVCESLIFSNILIKKRDYISYRYKISTNLAEKVRFHKLKLFLTNDSLRNCFQISTITVMGFFNRPTFLAFALFPVFFWLYRGIGNKLITPMNYHLRIIAFLICSIPAFLLNILVDSFYYGYLTWGEVGVLQISINNFVFTPLNFIRYNIDSNNLAKHGLHPRFLHILVNMPLLFNILAIFAFVGVLERAYHFVRGRHHLLPTVRSIKGLMLLSYIAPLTLLSIFPHQEPRFLIPLIIPLVYLHSTEILPDHDKLLIKLEHPVLKNTTRTVKETSIYMKLWIAVNLILVVFFGFLHQGGVFRSVNFLSKAMKKESHKFEFYVVTSHIYTLPQSLLLQRSSDTLHYGAKSKYAVSKRYFLYEEGATDLDVLIKNIGRIYNNNEQHKRRFKMLFLIPSSLEERFNDLAVKHPIQFKKLTTFYPHISTEAFPDLGQDLFHLYSNFSFNELKDSAEYVVKKIMFSFGLNMYEVAGQ